MMDESVYLSDSTLATRAVGKSQVPEPPCSRTAVAAAAAAMSRRQRAVPPPLVQTTPARAAELLALLEANPGASAEAQCRRLRLAREFTAMEAQRFLDIRHPPARVLNLRQNGYSIADRWVRQTSELGHEHRTKAYSVLGLDGQAEAG